MSEKIKQAVSQVAFKYYKLWVYADAELRGADIVPSDIHMKESVDTQIEALIKEITNG